MVVGTAAAVVLSQGTAQASTYRVEPGDTLSELARSHGTTVEKLARANHLADPNRIYVGQKLSLNGRSQPVFSTHEVKPGETLSSIANRSGTTVASLVRLNEIANPNLIIAGTRLRVRGSSGGGSSQAVPQTAQTHVVLGGETLSDIAARYGTTVDAIVGANDLADPNLIVIGQKLDIPEGGPASVEQMLESEAAGHGVDPPLVKAVAWQESGWNQKARSSVGAIGIMQVMPGTARYINRVLLGANLHVRRAADNVKLGVAYLRHVLDITGSERKGLAAYYSGPGNVGRKLKSYQKPYVNAVQALKARFR